MVKKISVLLTAFLLMFAVKVNAQVTTSGMTGEVEAAGEQLIGAVIEAVHTPSGTRYTAVSNENGLFTINGMRVGGPYEVTVRYIGYETKVYKGITLQLGENFNLNALLTEGEVQLDDVVVTAQATKFTTQKTGASTNISNEQMLAMPTVSRSITDFTRLSPYGGNGMTFAGTDGRTGNFTVDGANFNNNFGLSSSLPGGGNPISIEAIEEMQVVISPYDVRQSNFIGGGINAITKSGTNTFKGSAYVFYRNENMRGDAIESEPINSARETDRKTTYGFTVGGPIIKNKLFFFVNGEMNKVPTIANRWRASEDGVANSDDYVSRTTTADLQLVSDHLKNKYGYDTGSYSKFPADESNYKFVARFDWNINDMHKLAVRYNYTKNRGWNAPNGTSMDGGSRMPGSRTSQYSMSYANSMYAIDNLVHSLSLDLNSRFSDNISNKFLATFSKLDDVRASESAEFPFFDILKDDNNYIAGGYELFTYGNAVHNTVWNIKDDITINLGAHSVTAGALFEHQMADNAYLRNGTGYYRYTSLDDFINGATPEVVCLTYGYDGENYPAARVQYNQLALYGQDDWAINKNFKLSYGVRFDTWLYNNGDLMRNQAIYDLAFMVDGKERHIDTGSWPSTKIMVSPRVGFNWDVFGDKSFKVRGGTGLFAGRLPLVFFTNMPTNSGMVQYKAQINAKEAAKKGFTMDEFAGGMLRRQELLDKLASLGYPMTITPEDGTVPSSISAVNPDFKMPQVWKTSLALDYSVPVSFPLTVTVEGIFNKTINAATVRDWSMRDVAGYSRFNGVDNRPIYPADFRTTTKAFVLENTDRGYGWIASASVNARPTDWMSIMAAYTHTVSKEITSLPGSDAESVFTYVPTVQGPNYTRLHNGANVTPDRFVASLTLHDKGSNHYSFIYEAWRGGSAYSLMTANDMNGDGYNYDALYIPTDEQVANGEFRFKTPDDRDRFMAYVHNNDFMKNQQGKYAEPYSVYSPWVHRLDFSYKHDFKLNVAGAKHKLQVGFDVKNILNFFNSSWGVSKIWNTNMSTAGRVLKYEGVDAQGYPTFSTPAGVNGDAQTFVRNHAIGQCWYASIGVKYIFN